MSKESVRPLIKEAITLIKNYGNIEGLQGESGQVDQISRILHIGYLLHKHDGIILEQRADLIKEILK